MATINRNKLIAFCQLCCNLVAVPILLTACSDWDDHYEADTQLQTTQGASLWQNIEHNGQLNNFAALLKKTGYDQVLDASQTYTVWAPLDGTYDHQTLLAQSDSRLTKEFIGNHIARSNYPVSGLFSQDIYMLNEKVMNFTSAGDNQPLSIQGIDVTQANLASGNGVIHLLNGMIPFQQNIYESLNNETFALDSVSNYFHGYDTKRLDTSKSVPGPVLNGEMTYLDSIFYEHNDLYRLFNAYINREDSNYTMILPTNEAWRKAKASISEMYNYVPSFEFMENTSLTSTEKKVTKVELKDVNFLKDSIVNMVLVRDLFYNNNIYDNKRLNNLQNGQTLQCDSLYSTSYSKVYTEDAAELFKGAQRVEKSNGVVWVTDSLRMRTWTSWNPMLIQEAENSSLVANVFNTAGQPSRVRVSSTAQNPSIKGKLSGSAYVEVQPSAQNTNPEVDFYLDDIRSTTYSMYLVVVPANIANVNRTALPHRMLITLGYNDETGKTKEQRLTSPETGDNYFVNDPTKIDTLYLGDFTFPIAYVGTGSSSQGYYPYLRVRSSVTNALSDQFDRTMRFDCLIFRPKALDTYLKEHPDYKFDDRTY